ncbi:MAG: hypothetical protein WB586_02690 [Chthoniobacterales bacterium]
MKRQRKSTADAKGHGRRNQRHLLSTELPAAPWQNWVTIPGSINDGHIARGIPDIAGNADPDSGYQLVQSGINIGAVGGTSAAAPLYAALVALMNASLGTRLGWLNPGLYSAPYATVFRDINDGGSNADGAPGYTAGPGWDACTGLGSVIGTSLMRDLTPKSTICNQAAQSITNVIIHNGPPFTVAGWLGVQSQLEQCVREGYLTQARVNALITEYENWLKTRGGPPRL